VQHGPLLESGTCVFPGCSFPEGADPAIFFLPFPFCLDFQGISMISAKPPGNDRFENRRNVH
jgi:hypothetical protein